MKKPVQRNVVLVLRLAYASHRELLHGITRYVRPHGLWRFRVIDYSADKTGEQLAAALATGGVDGVIAASLGHPGVSAGLAGWEGPLVAIGAPESRRWVSGRTAPIDFVGNDDQAIGVCGARFLESLGRFRSYGFAMSMKNLHGGRLRGFLSRLEGRGADVRTFNGGDISGQRLLDWVKSLPKPAGVMAYQDNMALELLSTASTAGVRVPADMAVIGVDNDEFICETASPTLTSIAPDHLRTGELAAQALRRRFTYPSAPATEVFVSSISIVERRSTKAVPPAVALAERARAFISRNAVRGISAADVVAHLGVSRTLAGLRFREVYGESLQSAIVSARLEEAKRRLVETDVAAGKIALACGFRSPKHAMRLFKARFGTTMETWRKTAR